MIKQLLSLHTDGRQAYQPIYNEFFTDEFCRTVKNILEIGIQSGVGLRAWLTVFPEARVYGYECHTAVMPDDIKDNQRLEVHTGLDSSVETDVDNFFERIHQVQMDIIIDDADHQENSQRCTLRYFWPHLAPGGIYVLEDTGPRVMSDPFVLEIQSISTGGKVHPRIATHLAGVVVITK